jgi:hypothetical protein
MNLRLLAAALALAAAPVAFAADDENPYKKAKVGDFSTYKMTTKVAGANIEGTMTQEVTAKDDKEATVRTSGKVSGTDIPPNDVKIDLTKPYDPTKATGPLPPGANVQVEKLKDGKEKIKVAGKEYDATWETYKMKVTQAGMSFEAEMKVWQSKEVAIPILKMEMNAEVQGQKMEVAMEMTETGNKPAGTTPEKK